MAIVGLFLSYLDPHNIKKKCFDPLKNPKFKFERLNCAEYKKLGLLKYLCEHFNTQCGQNVPMIGRVDNTIENDSSCHY